MSDSLMLFAADVPEGTRPRTKELVRLKPYGVSLVPDPQRPILILKSESGALTLPVAINPIEAGVTLTQFNKLGPQVTPHRATEKILASLDVKIDKCVFVEIKGHFQFVRLYFKKHPHLKTMKMRAEEAMSLCLHLQVPIFATESYIMASRELQIQQAFAGAQASVLLSGNSDKPSGYMQ